MSLYTSIASNISNSHCQIKEHCCLIWLYTSSTLGMRRILWFAEWNFFVIYLQSETCHFIVDIIYNWIIAIHFWESGYVNHVMCGSSNYTDMGLHLIAIKVIYKKSSNDFTSVWLFDCFNIWFKSLHKLSY